MTTNEPLFDYHIPGFRFTVYSNRIETKGLIRKETIPIRQVTSVDLSLSGQLIIRTADDKKRSYALGFQTKKARDIIAGIL